MRRGIQRIIQQQQQGEGQSVQTPLIFTREGGGGQVRIGCSSRRRRQLHSSSVARMRVLTHNFLMCAVRGCTAHNYPLAIKATTVETVDTEFSVEFMRNMIPKLDWLALVAGCKDLNIQIPETMPENAMEDEAFLKNLHHVLNNVRIQEGALVCPNCSRAYPISQGIPNMLLTEEEI